MVLLDLVSLLPLSAQCVLPRKGFLALRPTGVKMDLERSSVLQRLLQTGCASSAVCTAVSHDYVLYMCWVLGPSYLPAEHAGKAALVWGSLGGFLKL